MVMPDLKYDNSNSGRRTVLCI